MGENQPLHLADPEAKRIRSVYAGYGADPRAWARWDPRNQGNMCMREEFDKAVLAALGDGAVRLREARVLDVGCGAGATLERLAQHGAQPRLLFGVDLREEPIESARKSNPGTNFICADARRLSFPDRTFDLIICNNVFGSILDQAVADAVAGEIRRVVKLSGLIIWCDSRYPNPWNHDVRGYSAREIRRFFPGFRVELRSMTVLPPLSRRLGRFTRMLYPLLARIPVLRGRYLAVIRPHAAAQP